VSSYAFAKPALATHQCGQLALAREIPATFVLPGSIPQEVSMEAEPDVWFENVS
jgi:hypothetical protein